MKRYSYRDIVTWVLSALALYLMFSYDCGESGVSLAFLGNLIRAAGSGKEVNRLKKQRFVDEEAAKAIMDGPGSTLEKAKAMKKLASKDHFASRLASVKEERPKLKFDNSRFVDIANRAKTDAAIDAAGRTAGIEEARDSVRRTTANTIAAGEKAATSGASLINFVGQSQQAENEAMENINAVSAQQREQSIREGRNRVDSAEARLADFDAEAFAREFQFNEVGAYDQAKSDQRMLESQINEARAAKREAFAGLIDGATESAISLATAGIASPTGFTNLFGKGVGPSLSKITQETKKTPSNSFYHPLLGEV